MEESKDKIVNIPVEDILPNRFQPRLAFDESELNELSNSIKKYGVLQPVILRKIGDKYEIIAGERRYKATVLAGLKTIPAIINNTDDNTSAEIALLENLQRKNLTVIEEAQSFKKLLERGFTQDEIANKLGISQSSIANKVRLLNLPKKVQDALLYSKISERHARSLLSLSNQEEQEELLERIINERLTVKQTEDEISRILNRFKEEVDIPDGIQKFIDRDDTIQEIEEEKEKVEEPIVEPKIIKETYEDTNKEMSPFQSNFESNLRKIEEIIQNKEDSYYDRIIDNDMKKNNYEENNHENKFIYENNNKSIFEENKAISIPYVISRVRNLIKDIDDEVEIETQEENLPDKYKIVIEIKKDN